jgi:hypothetical protein
MPAARKVSRLDAAQTSRSRAFLAPGPAVLMTARFWSSTRVISLAARSVSRRPRGGSGAAQRIGCPPRGAGMTNMVTHRAPRMAHRTGGGERERRSGQRALAADLRALAAAAPRLTGTQLLRLPSGAPASSRYPRPRGPSRLPGCAPLRGCRHLPPGNSALLWRDRGAGPATCHRRQHRRGDHEEQDQPGDHARLDQVNRPPQRVAVPSRHPGPA